jgi:hypothetical protein
MVDDGMVQYNDAFAGLHESTKVGALRFFEHFRDQIVEHQHVGAVAEVIRERLGVGIDGGDEARVIEQGIKRRFVVVSTGDDQYLDGLLGVRRSDGEQRANPNRGSSGKVA